MGQFLPCFKAYDVRGKVPSELNPEIAYDIARAFADQLGPKKVCIGYDIRLSGPELYEAMARGFNDAGVEVVHLGLVGTEMVYFATAHFGFDGGAMITASHNPPESSAVKLKTSRMCSNMGFENHFLPFTIWSVWKRKSAARCASNNLMSRLPSWVVKK